MKKKILILGVLIILILLWSPWMFDDGGENTINVVKYSSDLSREDLTKRFDFYV